MKPETNQQFVLNTDRASFDSRIILPHKAFYYYHEPGPGRKGTGKRGLLTQSAHGGKPVDGLIPLS